MSDYSGDGSTHVFILRLWRETGASPDTKPEWRALIENVSSKLRFPIKDMTALHALFAPFGDDLELNNFLTSQQAPHE